MWTFRHRHKRDIVTITKEKDAKLLLSRRGEWIMLTSPNKPPKLDDELPPEDKAWKTPKMPNPGYSLKPQEVPVEAPESDVDAPQDGIPGKVTYSVDLRDMEEGEVRQVGGEFVPDDPAVTVEQPHVEPITVKKRGRKPKNA